ncbi:MarR family transcriptional regulator [Actinokineospora sp. PR83]|uniref:MarR family winged helix-turn-helix transcriptional regulator n=1 Tax=Actinokineospora sp. PR83 TaxID=2884908 RepID=UPI001F421AB9|nr:MarR family transcriptional regulator [Actinokineospora sp. PR83]MCG8916376.1 MarR family transcriptional regulator [Actinokineospora sp. PR83]
MPTDAGEADDLLAALLPRLSQISTAVTRGKLDERAMAAAGVALERPAMTVLTVLHVAGEPLRVGEIATRMQVVGPHVTRQLNALEARHLVQRVTDPDDSRARLVELTSEGRDLATRYLGVLFGWFTEALADWSPQDRRTLTGLLARFADDLTAHLARFAD